MLFKQCRSRNHTAIHPGNPPMICHPREGSLYASPHSFRTLHLLTPPRMFHTCSLGSLWRLVPYHLRELFPRNGEVSFCCLNYTLIKPLRTLTLSAELLC